MQTAEVAQLVDDARAGDHAAFAALYAAHVADVRRYARRLVVHEHLAEDLVAEAFVRTWEQLAAGKGPRLAFMGYMRAVVMNLHVSRVRHDQRVRSVEDIDHVTTARPELALRTAEHSPEHLVIQRLLNERLRHALAGLPHRHQVVLVRVHIEGAPYREVAAHLDLTVTATRQLAARARRAMRQILEELHRADDAAA